MRSEPRGRGRPRARWITSGPGFLVSRHIAYLSLRLRDEGALLANQPLSVLHDNAAVSGDWSGGWGVDDRVPVQGRLVRPAGLGIALAQREVDCATDLLVVKDASGKAVDAAVQAEPQLTQAPRTG